MKFEEHMSIFVYCRRHPMSHLPTPCLQLWEPSRKSFSLPYICPVTGKSYCIGARQTKVLTLVSCMFEFHYMMKVVQEVTVYLGLFWYKHKAQVLIRLMHVTDLFAAFCIREAKILLNITKIKCSRITDRLQYSSKSHYNNSISPLGVGLSASYTALVTWLLSLVPDNFDFGQSSSSGADQTVFYDAPFHVVGLQQLWLDEHLNLVVAVTPTKAFDAKFVPTKPKKSKVIYILMTRTKF